MDLMLEHTLVAYKALGSVKMISDLHQKINDIVQIVGLSSQEDGSILVHYATEPTQEQLDIVNNFLSNIDLENARFDKLQSIDDEWKATLANGWSTPDGWKLGIDIQDVALLTGAYMLAKEAAELGSADPVHIIDTDGIAHPLTLAQLTPLMLQYGQARAVLSSTYANRKNTVKNATTLQEIEEA